MLPSSDRAEDSAKFLAMDICVTVFSHSAPVANEEELRTQSARWTNLSSWREQATRQQKLSEEQPHHHTVPRHDMVPHD